MEKLQLSQWLISATLLKISHLRGTKTNEAGSNFDAKRVRGEFN
jgi:hypothetical protein